MKNINIRQSPNDNRSYLNSSNMIQQQGEFIEISEYFLKKGNIPFTMFIAKARNYVLMKTISYEIKLTPNEFSMTAKQLFKSIDVDQNGKIDYTEFLAATIQRVNYLKNERLYEAFCMFDKDKSGNITKDELLRALKAEKSQEKEIEKYIKAVDKNGDGKIDYKEFLELMGAQQ